MHKLEPNRTGRKAGSMYCYTQIEDMLWIVPDNYEIIVIREKPGELPEIVSTSRATIPAKVKTADCTGHRFNPDETVTLYI